MLLGWSSAPDVHGAAAIGEIVKEVELAASVADELPQLGIIVKDETVGTRAEQVAGIGNDAVAALSGQVVVAELLIGAVCKNEAVAVAWRIADGFAGEATTCRRKLPNATIVIYVADKRNGLITSLPVCFIAAGGEEAEAGDDCCKG